MTYNLTNSNESDKNDDNAHFWDIEAQTVMTTKNVKPTFNFNYYASFAGFLLLIAAFVIICISGFISADLSLINVAIHSISSKQLLMQHTITSTTDIEREIGERRDKFNQEMEETKQKALERQQTKQVIWFDQEQHEYQDLFKRIYVDDYKTEYEIWSNNCQTGKGYLNLCTKPKTSQAIKQFRNDETPQLGHALPKAAILDRYISTLRETLPTTSSLLFAKAPNNWGNHDMLRGDTLQLVLKKGVVNPYLKYLDNKQLINVTNKGWGGQNGYGYIENAGWTTDPLNEGRSIERWYPNFADASLFYAGKFWLLGQDEQMSLEMPILWGLRHKFVEEMQKDIHRSECPYTVQKARSTDFGATLKNCKHQLFNGAILRNVPQYFKIEARQLGVFGDQYELYEMAGGTRSDDGKWTMTNYPGTDKDKTDAKWTMHYNGYQFKLNQDDTQNFEFRGDNAWTDTNNIYIFAAIDRLSWKPMRKWEWGLPVNAPKEPYKLKPRQVRICKGALTKQQHINMVPIYPLSHPQQYTIQADLCTATCVKYGKLHQDDKATLLTLWQHNGKAATLQLNTAKYHWKSDFLNGYAGDIHLCYDDRDVSRKLIWFGNDNHHWKPIQTWKWGETPEHGDKSAKKNLNPKARVRLCPYLKPIANNHPILGRLCWRHQCVTYEDLKVEQQEQLRDQWLAQHKQAEITLTADIHGLGDNGNIFYFCYDDGVDLTGSITGGSGEYIYYGEYNGLTDNLPYTMNQFNVLFRKAFTTFALIKDTANPSEKDSRFYEVHLGNWGGGIFQNDVTANLLVQFVASASTDIDGIVYHDPPKMGIVTPDLVQGFLKEMSEKVFEGKEAMSLEEFLSRFEKYYVEAKRFKFGQITSWISSDDESAQVKS